MKLRKFNVFLNFKTALHLSSKGNLISLKMMKTIQKMHSWSFSSNIHVYQRRTSLGIILLWYEIVVNNKHVYLRFI